MIYFVTENFLKTETSIQFNVDATDFAPFIKTSSDMQIQPMLGTFFYDALLVKYNDQSLDADEETLVGYIKPIIAWATCSEAVASLSRQLKNKGLQQQFGEFSNGSDRQDIAFYMDQYNQKADFYKKRLATYLKKNGNLFTDYQSDENNDSNIKPTKPDKDFNNSFFSV